MKNLFLSLIAAGMLMSSCSHSNQTGSTANNTAANASEAPVMKFEKETHDFGKIKSGDKVTYDFKFTNAGRLPLIITDAQASCGCTRPEWPHNPVNPHESGAIKVTFN